MAEFCIGSPHKNDGWYDYRVYCNLIESLQQLGHTYQCGAINRIYFLAAPLRENYPDVGAFDPKANNIALAYCHSSKMLNWNCFDHIFVSSRGMKQFLLLRKIKRCDLFGNKYLKAWHKIGVIPPFSSLQATGKIQEKYQCDLSFIGNERIRPIVEDTIDIVAKHQLKLKIFGFNWDNYQGDPRAKNYWVGSGLPYEDFPDLALSSKLCLVDHHQEMNREKTVSHKYVDLVSAGGCVISDNNQGVTKDYAGLVYSDRQQLEALIISLLDDEKRRQQVIQRQQTIVNQQSSHAAATTLASRFV